VDNNGEMIGVIATDAAIKMAKKAGFDLVEISPNANPPVCKIMDYGKFRYEQQKRAQAAKKKQKVVETKEIKVRPNIADGDYQTKLRHAQEFINAGNKVRVSLQFRGREITHEDIGLGVIERFKKDIEEIAKVEVEPKKEGRQIFMVVCPK
jgi:translation initiation factor IF-3